MADTLKKARFLSPHINYSWDGQACDIFQINLVRIAISEHKCIDLNNYLLIAYRVWTDILGYSSIKNLFILTFYIKNFENLFVNISLYLNIQKIDVLFNDDGDD